jgi:DivIVA domain-containing protein
MSATELDLPVLASPEQIRRREFVTARRGYDPEQVRDFLERIADQVQKMQAMIRETRMEADAAARAGAELRTDPYERLAARWVDTLRAADEQAAAIRLEADGDARRATEEARAEADRIRTDAQAWAEETRAAAERALREARDEAERTIADLSSRRDQLTRQLAEMRYRILGVAEDLGSALGDGGPAESVTDRVTEPQPDPATDTATDPEADAAVPAEPRYEDLWDGTDTIRLDLPDIPSLDLSWDVPEEDESS